MAVLTHPHLIHRGPLVDDIDCATALWFNRGMGSEMGVAQLLALKVFSSTTLEF